MFRSRWIRPIVGPMCGPLVKAVAGVLTLAGLALSQAPQERLLLVQEKDKPAQTCRVLKSWVEKDGSKLCQVQDVKTNELLTILEVPGAAPAKGEPKGVVTRIFHWGEGNRTPPKGVPVAPATATVQAPCAECAPQRLKPAAVEKTVVQKPCKECVPDSRSSAQQVKVVGSLKSAPTKVEGTEQFAKGDGEVKSSDWRKSWGRAERFTHDGSTTKSSLLVAEKRTDDPLKHPEMFTKTTNEPPLLNPEPAPAAKSEPKTDTTKKETKPTDVSSAKPLGAQIQSAAGTSQPSGGPQLVPVSERQLAPETGPLGPLVSSSQTTLEAPKDSPLRLPPVVLSGVQTPPAAPSTQVSPAPLSPSAKAPQTEGTLWAKLFGDKPTPPASSTQTGDSKLAPAPAAIITQTTQLNPSPEIVPTPTQTPPITQAPGTQTRVWTKMFGGKQTSPSATPVANNPNLPPGMGSVIAAGFGGTPPIVAGSAQNPAGSQAGTGPLPPNVQMASAPNAFTIAQPGMPPMGYMTPPPGYAMLPQQGPYPPMQMPMQMPIQPGMNIDTGAAEGNAFAAGGMGRPIPADFGVHPQTNAFLQPGTGMAGIPPMPRPGMPYPPMMGQANMMPQEAMPNQDLVQVGHMGSEQPDYPVQVSMGTLHDSLYPSEREWAAQDLGKCNWRTEPQAVQALLASARTDPAPMVRVACLRALAKMKVNTVPAVQDVQALKSDPDLRVRQQAEQTLAVLMAP